MSDKTEFAGSQVPTLEGSNVPANGNPIPAANMRTRTIKVDYLARVEGEGALFLKVKGDKVQDVQLKIFEPPRFFVCPARAASASSPCNTLSEIDLGSGSVVSNAETSGRITRK